MRILRMFVFLLIATCAFAQSVPPAQAVLPPGQFTIDLRNHDRSSNSQTQIEPLQWAKPYAFDPNDNTCYFIRSYVMKREGEAGATHLDHVTTCTPKSRIRMKTKVKFTPAVVQPEMK